MQSDAEHMNPIQSQHNVHYVTSYSQLLQHIPPHPSLLHISNYLFFTVGKGIYICIRNGDVHAYIFNNQSMLNDWAHVFPFKYHTSIMDYMAPVLENQACQPILQGCSRNNYLVRCEYPFRMNVGRDMVYVRCITDLVHKHMSTLDEGHIFINRRDFPVLSRLRFGAPLLPLCSLVHSVHHWDGWFPNEEEIQWLSTPFPEEDTSDAAQGSHVPFYLKHSRMCFRGSATGYGITGYDNPRIRVVSSDILQDDPFYDIGCTPKRTRVKLYQCADYARTVTPHTDGIGFPNARSEVVRYQPQSNIYVKDRIPLHDMAMYKYVLCLSGHVYPFRMLYLMSHGCVILWNDKSVYKPWFHEYIHPYEHYIPIDDRADYVVDSIQSCTLWIHDNPDQVSRISVQARNITRTLHNDWCTYWIRDHLSRLTQFAHDQYSLSRSEWVCLPPPSTPADCADWKHTPDNLHVTPTGAYYSLLDHISTHHTNLSTYTWMDAVERTMIDVRGHMGNGWYVDVSIDNFKVCDDVLEFIPSPSSWYVNVDRKSYSHHYPFGQLCMDMHELDYTCAVRDILIPMCELVLFEYQQRAILSIDWLKYIARLAKRLPILFGGYSRCKSDTHVTREECVWLVEWCSRFIIDGRYRPIHAHSSRK